MRRLIVVLVLVGGCGDGREEPPGPPPCHLERGIFDCTLAIEASQGECDQLVDGQNVTWFFAITAIASCAEDSVAVDPALQGEIWVSYDGWMEGTTPTRIDGFLNYRLGKYSSGPPECRLAGPVLCTHR